jgi:hypothetical protein
MITTLETQWPIFAPINIEFDRVKLYKEIIESSILESGNIATSHRLHGKNYWDNSDNFQSEQFKKLKDVPLWTNEHHTELSDYKIKTFYQVNVTTFSEDSLTTVWEGKLEDKTKVPLWIKYNFPWRFRSDINLPYLQQVINDIGLDYVSMIRIVYQTPPSIGLAHKDSGPNTNLEYYNNNGVSITLNVSDGGANLFFVDRQGNEQCIDEKNIFSWHFDDSTIHCTTEVTSPRIQIRIYGKHSSYRSIMNLRHSI